MSTPLPMPLRILEGVRRLAPDARAVVVAVSGGSDSVALLRGLVQARESAGPTTDPGVPSVPRLVVAHLDHGLRDGSAEDAAWVDGLCRRLDVPFRSERVRVAEVAARTGRNVEETGRTLRYAFFARVAREEGCTAIATAHTRDDQAETVLLQLLRGSARTQGIAPRRGSVVRPLLDLSKADLRHWLDRIGQTWREDPTNRDTSRDRSWIRHQLMPRLELRRPGAATRIARFGRVQRDLADFLRDEAARRFGHAPVARSALAGAPVALQREVLVRLVREAGGEADALHLDAMVDALPGRSALRRDLPGGVRLRLLPDRVDVVSTDDPDGRPTGGFGREVREPHELPEGVPADVLAHGPLHLRTWRPGDRIRGEAGTRKVADVLGDAGVPREDRPSVRVLAREDRVLWVEGVATAEGVPEAAADPDLPFMRRALELADRAAAEGELPVGAVVVRAGRIVGEGRNRREASGDPSAHAEVEAMRAAAAACGDWRLSGGTLYVTLEPCPMCAGAVLMSHLDRVVWGAANLRDGALGTVGDVGAAPWKRTPERRAGVLAGASRRRLERFFAKRREAVRGTD